MEFICAVFGITEMVVLSCRGALSLPRIQLLSLSHKICLTETIKEYYWEIKLYSDKIKKLCVGIGTAETRQLLHTSFNRHVRLTGEGWSESHLGHFVLIWCQETWIPFLCITLGHTHWCPILLILSTCVFCVIIKWVKTPEQWHGISVVTGTISNIDG
jgi:hypothetical protein